jgi:hypothetical protein
MCNRLGTTAAVAGLILACGFVTRVHAKGRGVGQPRRAVNQIVPLQDKSLIIRNDFGNLFKTTDGGRHWRKIGGHTHYLAVSDGRVLWSFIGWPGIHEAPMAEVWRSGDLGETWQERKFDVPTERSEALFALLPAVVANQPAGPPLVLMYNLQLKRPEPWTDLRSWSNVGVPVPIDDRAFGVWHGAAVEHRGTYYAAVGRSQIFMSTDAAKTWTDTSVPCFDDAILRCLEDTCYSLLIGRYGKCGAHPAQLGTLLELSASNRLYGTRAGTNRWTRTVDLSAGSLTPALRVIARGRPPIRRFEATAMVVNAEGIYVAGVVNSRFDCFTTITGKDCSDTEWGVVVRVSREGKVSPVGKSFDEGVWSLERDAEGLLWAGGSGAFRLMDGAWVRMWQEE